MLIDTEVPDPTIAAFTGDTDHDRHGIVCPMKFNNSESPPCLIP